MALPQTCKICLNNFAIQHTNCLVLSCSHPICEHCIKSICIDRSVVCPVCWKMTQLQNNTGNPLSSSNRSSLPAQTSSTTMIGKNLVSRHVPIQLEKKIRNKEEETLVISIKNGDYMVQGLREMSDKRIGQKEENLNTFCEELTCYDNSALFKKEEDPVKIEIVNDGKPRLKVPQQYDLPLRPQKELNPPKSDFKIKPKIHYREKGVAEVKTLCTQKVDNLSSTKNISTKEPKIENKKGSNPLITVLALQKKNFFIPKFGANTTLSKYYRVRIMAVFDPHRLYIQILDDDLRRLGLLNKQLQLQFKALPSIALKISAIKNPTEGCTCAVLKDGVWHRGMVKRQFRYKDTAQNFEVMLVDTGFCCRVPPQHVQPLHTIYQELPAQALRCKLDDIRQFEPKNNSNQPLENMDHYWPTHVLDLIRTKTKKMAEISVLDFVSGGVGDTTTTCEATLLVKMVVDGELTSVNEQIDCVTTESLSPKSEHLSNALLLQTFTSVPANTRRRRAKKPNKTPVPAKHFDSPTNSKRCSDIRVTVRTDSPSGSTCNNSNPSSSISRHPDTSCHKKTDAEQRSPTLRVWTYSDPKTALPHCFDGVVTWVDDNGGLYVHDCKWSKQLALIRDTLNATFNQSKPIRGDVRYQPEDPCLAKYESNWYRAIIKAVNKQKNTAKVFFVDYGATVNVQLCHIRVDTILDKIPVQTFRCSLHNLIPMVTKEFDVNANWPDAVIGYFHATAVNQEFKMSVKCYSPLRIAMQFVKNAMDLTDFMVTAQLGEYIVNREQEIKE
ncbi:hypothetical protein GHT06_011239 [Daphnia sinensis]|uniref:RING-type domain-containing protein n=1 Tax=Daphnia sinensis TaxID=1820382 RepID=A0AAD5Q1X0_9CRUS|nr:hypothetical protein GHT06_011239 [Daphnia sinensis]